MISIVNIALLRQNVPWYGRMFNSSQEVLCLKEVSFRAWAVVGIG
jgi:hypothetical protein